MARNSAYHSASSLRRRRVILQLQLQQEENVLPSVSTDALADVDSSPAEHVAELPKAIPFEVLPNTALTAAVSAEGVPTDANARPTVVTSASPVVKTSRTPSQKIVSSKPVTLPVKSVPEPAPTVVSETIPSADQSEVERADSIPASPVIAPPMVQIGTVPSTVPGLLRLMRATPRLHWLFAGDSLEHGGTSPAKGSQLMQAIQQHVHRVIGRTGDVFTSCETEGFRLRDLLDRFNSRVSNHSPQIVVITCGTAELQTRGDSPLAFERMFHRLILKIRNSGAVPIITTPPWSCPADDIHHSDELVRLEAIRACAEESAALLVDYWEEWEHHSVEEMFIPPHGQQLSTQGRETAVREFARALQLSAETAAFEKPPQQIAIS